MTKITVQEVQRHFAEKYSAHYALNDAGHREDHFLDVQGTGLAMNEALGLGQDPALITIVAWVHDLFAWDRAQHHHLSAEWVYRTEDAVIATLTPEERRLVAEACREHRASWKGEFTSTLSELISSADRGMASTREVLYRAYRYGVERDNLTVDQGVVRAVEHLQEKFGRYGYQRLPEFYSAFYADKLEERYREIERLQYLTLGQVKEYLDLV